MMAYVRRVIECLRLAQLHDPIGSVDQSLRRLRDGVEHQAEVVRLVGDQRIRERQATDDLRDRVDELIKRMEGGGTDAVGR